MKTTIDGGKGNDTIYNGVNEVSINGGTGKDVISLASTSHLIQYAAGGGNDTIYGFNETDTLTISGGSYSTTSSGNDVIVTVGKGKILLVGANGKNLNINKTGTTEIITLTDDDDYFNNNLAGVKISGKDGNDTIINDYFWNSEKQDSEYQDDVTIIDGGAGNDSILSEGGDYFSIHGGDVADTLSGGSGNDSLWGDEGADKFIYTKGDGKDIIFGFDSKDTLTLDGLGFTTAYSKSNGTITFKVNGGSVVLRDFTASTFNVNDNVYKISGSELVKK